MKKYILGINWEQNSSASLFCNKKCLGALSNERISRKKTTNLILEKQLITSYKNLVLNQKILNALFLLVPIGLLLGFFPGTIHLSQQKIT